MLHILCNLSGFKEFQSKALGLDERLKTIKYNHETVTQHLIKDIYNLLHDPTAADNLLRTYFCHSKNTGSSVQKSPICVTVKAEVRKPSPSAKKTHHF